MSLISSKSFDGLHEAIFDDRPRARNRYKLNGKPTVGVTTAIKAGMPTPEALINWKIGEGAKFVWNKALDPDDYDIDDLVKQSKFAYKKASEDAAGIGTIVHEYAYLVSLKQEKEALQMLAKHEESPFWNEIVNAVYKVDSFNEQHKDEIVALETMVASPTYGVVGRFDRLVRRNGLLIISDYKTSKGFYLEQFVQDALYSICIKEWLGLEVGGYEVIRFGKEGGDFQPLLITDPQELASFRQMGLRCLENYEWLKNWNKDSRFAYKKKKTVDKDEDKEDEN